MPTRELFIAWSDELQPSEELSAGGLSLSLNSEPIGYTDVSWFEYNYGALQDPAELTTILNQGVAGFSGGWLANNDDRSTQATAWHEPIEHDINLNSGLLQALQRRVTVNLVPTIITVDPAYQALVPELEAENAMTLQVFTPVPESVGVEFALNLAALEVDFSHAGALAFGATTAACSDLFEDATQLGVGTSQHV